MAQERAAALKDQCIMDMHTHFLRDDTRNMNFVNMRNAVGKAGWNKTLADKEQTIEDLKYDNYLKEMFLDSDTKIALISSAPSDIEHDWFLTNEQMAEAREKVNERPARGGCLAHHLHAGAARLARAAGAGLALKPDSVKGYTIGDNTHKNLSKYPWRMDDEKVAYKGYELMVKAGIKKSASTRGCSRRRSRSSSRICAALPTSPTWARPRRTGRSSISSSITRRIVTSAAIRQWRWPSSSAQAASHGPRTSPTFRRNTG